MLLGNLNPPRLCKGIRLQVTVMRDNVIKATILTVSAAGEIAFISIISMIPTDLPFEFKSPIPNKFAVTINKAQGQTIKYEIKYIGVDL